MIDNLDDIDVDAYFGVILAKVQLDAMEKEPDLEKMVEYLFEKGPTVNHPLGPNLNNVARHILSADNWLKIGLKVKKQLNCKIRPMDRKQKIFSSRNSPNETESDMCLSQLIDEADIKKKMSVTNFKCEISEECHQIMTAGRPWGYALTHRVIYFLVGESQGCKEKSVESLCCNIRKEILDIESDGFPLALRDLFMEQVLVCALSGYGEFLQSAWLQHVFRWQKKEGCWGIEEIPRNKIIQDDNTQSIQHDLLRFESGYKRNGTGRAVRTRRSTQPLGEGGCSSHMTGIGVALLAFAARHDDSINFD